MKFLFLFLSLVTSVSAFASIDGKWKVEQAECWFNYRRTTCDNQTPQAIELDFKSPKIVMSLANGSTKSIDFKAYGDFPELKESAASAMYYQTNSQVRYEEAIYKNWNLNNSWIFGEAYGSKYLYLIIGYDITTPRDERKVYYLNLYR